MIIGKITDCEVCLTSKLNSDIINLIELDLDAVSQEHLLELFNGKEISRSNQNINAHRVVLSSDDYKKLKSDEKYSALFKISIEHNDVVSVYTGTIDSLQIVYDAFSSENKDADIEIPTIKMIIYPSNITVDCL